MKEHYKNARWFYDNRGVSRHKLKRLAANNQVRTLKAGKSKTSPRTWCVEDYDAAIREERELAEARP